MDRVHNGVVTWTSCLRSERVEMIEVLFYLEGEIYSRRGKNKIICFFFFNFNTVRLLTRFLCWIVKKFFMYL